MNLASILFLLTVNVPDTLVSPCLRSTTRWIPGGSTTISCYKSGVYVTANFDGDGDGDGFAYDDFRIACEGHEPIILYNQGDWIDDDNTLSRNVSVNLNGSMEKCTVHGCYYNYNYKYYLLPNSSCSLQNTDAAEAEDIKVSEVSEVTAEFDATSLADERTDEGKRFTAAPSYREGTTASSLEQKRGNQNVLLLLLLLLPPGIILHLVLLVVLVKRSQEKMKIANEKKDLQLEQIPFDPNYSPINPSEKMKVWGSAETVYYGLTDWLDTSSLPPTTNIELLEDRVVEDYYHMHTHT